MSLRAVFLAGLLSVSLVSAPANPAAHHEERYPVSLSISGGASKGAYEAGLNWGVLAIMRGIRGHEAVTGARFRELEMKSVSGTSAGGINTLLTALDWCLRPEAGGGLPNRVDDNLFRGLWLPVDVNRLLPDRADSPVYGSGDATLSRADLLKGADMLRARWQEPVFSPGCRVPFGVVVTRVTPEELVVSGVNVRNQRFLIPMELRVNEEGRVEFFFDPDNYAGVDDPAMILLPSARDAAPLSISDDQVEAVMLTTSAFPMGFGRKRLEYCRTSQVEVSEEREDGAAPPDPAAMVCPPGYVLEEAEFADGGLFDNIPIGFARILAESRSDDRGRHLPVTYIYLDPGRRRYVVPEPLVVSRCREPDPPQACRTMVHTLEAESQVLQGAIGTARNYELYRELTSDRWRLNLAELAGRLAATPEVSGAEFTCERELPYFERGLDCAIALRRTGRLLESAYARVDTPIPPPFSVDRLFRAGIVSTCRQADAIGSLDIAATCLVDSRQLRRQLGAAMVEIVKRADLQETRLDQRIRESRLSVTYDRTMRVSSLGGPITGELLGDFGAFLDLKFREYDYYAGVYDAAVLAADTICSQNFTPGERGGLYETCQDKVSEENFGILGIEGDPGARYVFALKARAEFGEAGRMQFAYDPMPPLDRDMQTIHDGLIAAQLAGYQASQQGASSKLVVEREFFDHLREEDFQPTPVEGRKDTLLSQIIDNPDTWSYELVRRVTSRLVELERQAEEVYAAREPDRKNREQASTGLMGSSAFVLQTATYRYPKFDFAPSTAPRQWWWRNVIPYELGVDFVEGDLTATWQPTWSLTPNTLLGVRGTLGFAGGLFSSAGFTRENYLGVGLDLTRTGDFKVISSLGITPTYYHTFKDPVDAPQDTFGGDVHVGFLNNRLRLAIGAREMGDVTNTWFLTLGLADLPGAIYWLTR